MLRRTRDYERGNLEAVRVIVAESWKAQGSAWLLDWARRTVARHNSSKSAQLFLVSGLKDWAQMNRRLAPKHSYETANGR